VVLRPPFPDEVVAALTGRAGRLPLYGFVRMAEGCLPLGRLQVTMHGTGRDSGTSSPRFEVCRLSIGDRLPFSVLDRVRPVPAAPLPDLGWLALLPDDAVAALRQFVTGWPVFERERLAGFLVQFSVCDAAIGSPYGGFATVEAEALRRLSAGLRPVPLQPLRWPADPTRLYVGPGLAVAAAEVEPGVFEIYAGSRHRAALRPLREPGFDWEYFNG
jgi:hypothetical protein